MIPFDRPMLGSGGQEVRRSGGQGLPFVYEKRGSPFIFMVQSQNDGETGRFWPVTAGSKT